MKIKAFTLIELLVVIAVISILASILFPELAQAKTAAQKSASLSNIKQIALAETMYQADYNDYFVLSTQDFANSSCPLPGFCLDNLPAPTLSWPDLLIPYIGSLTIFVDPGTGDPSGDFAGGGPHSIIQNWGSDAQYGYNYQFLSPMTANSNFGAYAVGHLFGLGRSGSAAIHPANTVMFSTAQSYASATGAASQFMTPDVDWLNPPGALQHTVASTDRVVFTSKGCYAGTAPLWTCGWVNNTPAGFGGPISANVRVFAPYAGGIVAWVDGHTKLAPAGALAAGTDFGASTPSDGPTPYGPTGAEITDVATYPWTLDGTLNDLQ